MSINFSHRTGVLYDFSIVKKAVFFIFDESKGKVDRLTVQINPSDGFRETSKISNIVDHKNPSNNKITMSSDYSSEDSSIDIRLRYNVYDEYNARTMDGMLPPSSLSGEVHLKNEKITSLPALIKYAGQNVKTLFEWGPIKHYGILQSAEVDYTRYSRWGEPLAGDATVRIKKISEIVNGKRVEPEIPMLIEGALKTYEKADTVLMVAELAASQALR